MNPELEEKYKITEGGFEVEVRITGGEGRAMKYELLYHELPPATQALLDQVKQELIGTVRLTAEEILDPKIVDSLKKRFMEKAQALLEQKLPELNPNTKKFLLMTLMKDMLGLGDLEILLNDPHLEEIVVNSATEPVRVFHKKHGWLETTVFIADESRLRDHLNTIARRVGRQITTLNPLLDAHLVSGDRSKQCFTPYLLKEIPLLSENLRGILGLLLILSRTTPAAPPSLP